MKQTTDWEKLNNIWMHKDTTGEPMQDPTLDNHWVLNVGDVVVESTTREGCLMKLSEVNQYKAKLLRRDLERYGGSNEDRARLKVLESKII